jgi:hypothetical protein
MTGSPGMIGSRLIVPKSSTSARIGTARDSPGIGVTGSMS